LKIIFNIKFDEKLIEWNKQKGENEINMF